VTRSTVAAAQVTVSRKLPVATGRRLSFGDLVAGSADVPIRNERAARTLQAVYDETRSELRSLTAEEDARVPSAFSDFSN
jgi:hypothetical protein